MKVLKLNGLPNETSNDQIQINEKKNNKSVTIIGLGAEAIRTIESNLHFPESHKKPFDKPLYCTPIRETTPVKKKSDETDTDETTESSSSHSTESSSLGTGDISGARTKPDESDPTKNEYDADNKSSISESDEKEQTGQQEQASKDKKGNANDKSPNAKSPSKPSNIPGLHLSKNALKKLKKKEKAERNQIDFGCEHSKDDDEKDPNDVSTSTSDKKLMLEEKWLSHITGGKHRLSPEDKQRSVRHQSLSEVN